MEYDLKEKAELLAPEGLFVKISLEARGIHVSIYSQPVTTYTNWMAGFVITPLLGNDSVLVFGNSFISPGHRHQGLGARLHQYRINIAHAVGAKVVLCTVNKDNAAQRALLAKRFKGVKWLGPHELYPGCLLYKGRLKYPKGPSNAS